MKQDISTLRPTHATAPISAQLPDGSGPIAPHGGELVDRVLRGQARESARASATELTSVPLSPMAAADLEMLATGALSPLTGFMRRDDYLGVLDKMRLASGPVWTLPVVLPVDSARARALRPGMRAVLTEAGRPLALIDVDEVYPYEKGREAREIYRTRETAHPGVERLMAQGDYYVGGDVWLFDWPKAARTEFPRYRHGPAHTRGLFAQRGWQRIVGFQTRNPIHRAHEYIHKTVLELLDGLLLHPLVGETRAGDIPAEVRMRSYETLLKDYYPADRVLLAVFPAAMRYAGPREAVFHALCRKNYGCTHFVVGRDHAGVGKYYGPFDSQHIFSQFPHEAIGITPLFFDHTFFCRACGTVVSARTCPHDPAAHVTLSGTEVRRLLEAGDTLPPEFTRPEVSKVLMEGMRKVKGSHE